MQNTRRNALKFIGGAAAGAVFTPAPWRLITDTALWSENWPGVPRPPRGEISARFTNCSICPAGCGVRARCVGGQPVSLAGVAGHPLSRGGLCAFGVAGHHLPYCPGRLTEGPVEEAAGAIARAAANCNPANAASPLAVCSPGETIAVLDLRPGRTASWTYRRAMGAVKNGLYLTAAEAFSGAAVDLAKARTVVSLGAPVLDGWGTPGNVLAARANFRLIQVEAIESRTASLADLWLRIRPGSASTLVLGIAAAMKKGSVTGAAAATGLTERQITDLADELTQHGPALVLPGYDCPEAWALNQLTGGWGETVVARQEAPVPEHWKNCAPVTRLESAPDGSIRTLIIDESAPGDYIPWNAIRRKLVADNPVVIAFAWSPGGYRRHSLFTLPTAVFPETLEDIPAATDSPAAVFRLAVPLVAAPAGVVNPPEFVAKAVGIDASNALRERADAIQKAGRGVLIAYADGRYTPAGQVRPDDFWKALNQGACWMDSEGRRTAPPAADFAAGDAPPADDARLPLVAVLAETAAATAPPSPLMSKLHRESNLRLGRSRAALHPGTARACGAGDGGRAVLETSLGKCEIEVVVDSSVPPGVVQVAAAPEVIDICGASARARVAPL
ncbi:MAG TPA: hypothetical protein VKF41_12265 [Bryobacteraceae bacterium]|nr:hypothetical protein [Bryobacteraceae bacterium]